MIFSIPIEGPSHTLTKGKKEEFEIKFDGVVFHFRGKELVGTVIIEEDDDEKEAYEKARNLIDKVVLKLCYIYNQKFIWVDVASHAIYLSLVRKRENHLVNVALIF